MKDLLEKLKLIDYLTTELEVSKAEFVSAFRNRVDDGEPSQISAMFDIFSSSNNEYRGRVEREGFEIRRKRKLFDLNQNLAIASGTYKQFGEKLVVETEINGFSNWMIPYYIVTIFFYAIFFGGILFASTSSGEMVGFIFPFIFLHAIFMLGLPYFLMKRSTQKMRYELEREFHYMIK